MPTVIGANKEEFDRKEMEKRGLISAHEKPNFQKTTKRHIPSKEIGNELPPHEMLTQLPNKAMALVKDNPYMKVQSLTDGKYQLIHSAQWGSGSNDFHGTGSDLTSLITAGLNRLEKSDKAIAAAKKAKFEGSLLGKLQKEYGDVFSTAHSAQSKSSYITHDPSETKIRISDHNLPLGYEQPDIDLRMHQTPDEQFNIVKQYLSPKENQ